MMRPERAQRLDSSPIAASGLEELKAAGEPQGARIATTPSQLSSSDSHAAPLPRRAQAAASAMTRHDPSAKHHDGGGSFV